MSALAWIKDKEYEWVLAEIVESNSETICAKCSPRAKTIALGSVRKKSFTFDSDERYQYDNTPILVLNKSQYFKFDPSHLEDWNDLSLLNELHEAPIINILRRRYLRDRIYTNAGDILISINPYKIIPGLYENPMEYHRTLKSSFSKPHVYVVASTAYKKLAEYNSYHQTKIINQSIIISGESGAGKTEASKYITNFLISINATENSSEDLKLKDLILNSTIALEAFGNAKNVQNNNSSRFGKYIKMQYTEDNHLISSKTEVFLLEKSRIISQNRNERNYHVFYQFLRGIQKFNPKLKQDLQLKTVDDYQMLTSGGCTIISNETKDEEDFIKLCMSLLQIGCTDEDLIDLWKVLAAILHLGNTVAVPSGREEEPSKLDVKSSSLGFVAELLGVDEIELRRNLTTHLIQTKGGSSFKVRVLTVAESLNNIHGLIKRLYSCIFSWLLQTINESQSRFICDHVREPVKFIGILDIFGFELLETNSFEQLCINFATERLQQQFIDFIFRSEQILYHEEGINWTNIAYHDNQNIIDLIAKKPNGLLNILEEHCMMNRSPDDLALLHQFHQTHGDRPDQLYVKPRFFKDPQFTIKHYPGNVTYDIEGFILKNNDALEEDLNDLIKESTSLFITRITVASTLAAASAAAEDEQANISAGRRQSRTPRTQSAKSTGFGKRQSKLMATATTVSSGARLQLDRLINSLALTEPHYIKCIKPNEVQAEDLFNSPYAMKQLRYSDIIEIIRIRRERFQFHFQFTEFCLRYDVLFRVTKHNIPKNFSNEKAKAFSRLIVDQYLSPDSYQYGRTQIFLRESAANKLQSIVNDVLLKYSTCIQKCFRRYYVCKLFKKIIVDYRNQLKDLNMVIDSEKVKQEINDLKVKDLKELKESRKAEFTRNISMMITKTKSDRIRFLETDDDSFGVSENSFKVYSSSRNSFTNESNTKTPFASDKKVTVKNMVQISDLNDTSISQSTADESDMVGVSIPSFSLNLSMPSISDMSSEYSATFTPLMSRQSTLGVHEMSESNRLSIDPVEYSGHDANDRFSDSLTHGKYNMSSEIISRILSESIDSVQTSDKMTMTKEKGLVDSAEYSTAQSDGAAAKEVRTHSTQGISSTFGISGEVISSETKDMTINTKLASQTLESLETTSSTRVEIEKGFSNVAEYSNGKSNPNTMKAVSSQSGHDMSNSYVSQVLLSTEIENTIEISTVSEGINAVEASIVVRQETEKVSLDAAEYSETRTDSEKSALGGIETSENSYHMQSIQISDFSDTVNLGNNDGNVVSISNSLFKDRNRLVSKSASIKSVNENNPVEPVVGSNSIITDETSVNVKSSTLSQIFSTLNDSQDTIKSSQEQSVSLENISTNGVNQHIESSRKDIQIARSLNPIDAFNELSNVTVKDNHDLTATSTAVSLEVDVKSTSSFNEDDIRIRSVDNVKSLTMNHPDSVNNHITVINVTNVTNIIDDHGNHSNPPSTGQQDIQVTSDIEETDEDSDSNHNHVKKSKLHKHRLVKTQRKIQNHSDKENCSDSEEPESNPSELLNGQMSSSIEVKSKKKKKNLINADDYESDDDWEELLEENRLVEAAEKNAKYRSLGLHDKVSPRGGTPESRRKRLSRVGGDDSELYYDDESNLSAHRASSVRGPNAELSSYHSSITTVLTDALSPKSTTSPRPRIDIRQQKLEDDKRHVERWIDNYIATYSRQPTEDEINLYQSNHRRGSLKLSDSLRDNVMNVDVQESYDSTSLTNIINIVTPTESTSARTFKIPAEYDMDGNVIEPERIINRENTIRFKEYMIEEKRRKKNEYNEKKRLEALSVQENEPEKNAFEIFMTNAVNDLTQGVVDITTNINNGLAPIADANTWAAPVNWISSIWQPLIANSPVDSPNK